MKLNCGPIARVFTLTTLITYFGLLIVPPYAAGLYYSVCGGHEQEQAYLDQCVAHIRAMQVACTSDPKYADADLAGILDYAAKRYSKIGAWNVMIFPLQGMGAPKSYKVIGCNVPLCPGITLDPSLLLDPPEDTAITIVHEAMHDYWPYLGHAHITSREQKLYELSYALRRFR